MRVAGSPLGFVIFTAARSLSGNDMFHEHSAVAGGDRIRVFQKLAGGKSFWQIIVVIGHHAMPGAVQALKLSELGWKSFADLVDDFRKIGGAFFFQELFMAPIITGVARRIAVLEGSFVDFVRQRPTV